MDDLPIVVLGILFVLALIAVPLGLWDRWPRDVFRSWLTKRELIVLGNPEDESHNCDAMGCSSVSHVRYRVPLPDGVNSCRAPGGDRKCCPLLLCGEMGECSYGVSACADPSQQPDTSGSEK
jgi:hypothetical protein